MRILKDLPLALSVALLASAALAEPFILGDALLDRVTAGGYALATDAMVSSAAGGSDALAVATTTASAGSGTSGAAGLATAVGDAGSEAAGRASASIAQAGRTLTVETGAAAVTSNATLVAVGLDARVQRAESGIAVEGIAVAHGGVNAASAKVSHVHQTAQSTLGGHVRIDAASTAGGTSTAFIRISAGDAGGGGVLAAGAGDAGVNIAMSTELSVAMPEGDMVLSGGGTAGGTGPGVAVQTRFFVAEIGRVTFATASVSATGEAGALEAETDINLPEGMRAAERTYARPASRAAAARGLPSRAVSQSFATIAGPRDMTVMNVREGGLSRLGVRTSTPRR